MRRSVVSLLIELSLWINISTSELCNKKTKLASCKEKNLFIITNSSMMSQLISLSTAGAWQRIAQILSLTSEITYGLASMLSIEWTHPYLGQSILETEWETTTFLSWFDEKIKMRLMPLINLYTSLFSISHNFAIFLLHDLFCDISKLIVNHLIKIVFLFIVFPSLNAPKFLSLSLSLSHPRWYFFSLNLWSYHVYVLVILCVRSRCQLPS